jgi:hypothetical protein
MKSALNNENYLLMLQKRHILGTSGLIALDWIVLHLDGAY